jgi:O-methyltransferase involved in polyketide biosynthesis
MIENKFQKSDIHLEGVPKTLLMPLLGRAKFSKESYSPIRDTLAIQLVESLNYNFDELEKHLSHVTLYFLARAYQFDTAIKDYLIKNPYGKIVNLGAGLETAFFRVDNQKMIWFDLDLPDVILLREKLLPKSDRVYTIAKSLLDYSWIDEIKKHGDEFFFFSGGVLPYFKEEDVKALLIEMGNRLPRSELFFDTISKKGMHYANKMLAQSNMSNASMKWSMDDATLLEGWSSHIKIVDQIRYFQKIKMMKRFPFMQRLTMLFSDLISNPQIIHLKFN